MRQSPTTYADPEDMFNDTRMSFGEHLEDLRIHLIRAGLGFVIGMLFALIFLGKPVLDIITKPVEQQLREYYKRTESQRIRKLREYIEEAKGLNGLQFSQLIDIRPLRAALQGDQGHDVAAPVVDAAKELLDDLGVDDVLDNALVDKNPWVEVPVRIGNPQAYLEALQKMKPYFDPPTMKTFTIIETVMVYFKVGLLTGLVLSSPWVFWQIWSFIAAGLYPNEKRLVHHYMPFSLLLFLSGVVLCEVFVIPKAIAALLWFNEWLGVDPELRLADWLDFAIMLPVVFGVSFQTPLVMMFFNKIGILDVTVYREKRRIAWFLMAVFAAVITPTPDPYNMCLLWVPMGLLYELGIILCEWQQRNSPDSFFGEEAPHDEMVEV